MNIGTAPRSRISKAPLSLPVWYQGTAKSALSAVLMLAAVTLVHAAQNPLLRTTGDELIAGIIAGPNDLRAFDEHYARGYIAGVADATEGNTWCAPTALSPAAIDAQIVDALAERSGAMPGIAAVELIKQYSSRFPLQGTCAFKPRLTGAQFVAMFLGNERKSEYERINPSTAVIDRQSYAGGYVGGVVDATQGSDWCARRSTKPHEVDARGYGALLDQPAQSMPGNAATLLHDQFVIHYPCPQS
jgi:hypothetical protein